MDLFVESANKIYEKIISLRNKKADKKTRDELQTQLEIDLMKNGGKKQLIEQLICEEEVIPVRCSLLEKQALKELLCLPYKEAFLNKNLVSKIEKVTEHTPTEWRMQDIQVVNKAKLDVERYKENIRRLKIVRKAIQMHAGIMHTDKKGKVVNYKYPIKIAYNEQLDQFEVIYICVFFGNKINNYFLSDPIEIMEHIEINTEGMYISDELWQELRSKLKRDLHTRRCTFRVTGSEHLKLFSHYDREVDCEGENTYKVTVKYSEIIEYNALRQDIWILGKNSELMELQNDLIVQAGQKNHATRAYLNYEEQT